MFDPNAPAPMPEMMQTTAMPGGPITLGGFPADQQLRGGKSDAFMTALEGWRTDMRDWRGQRPEDRSGLSAWRDLRPDRPGRDMFRNALMGQPAPGAPQPVPGAPMMPGIMPQAPAGNYGTALGVIGANPATSPTQLPTY